jgi:hypothetical protein
MSVYEVTYLKNDEKRLAKIIKKSELSKDKFSDVTKELGKYMKLVTFS